MESQKTAYANTLLSPSHTRIVIVAHAPLAAALLAVVAHVHGAVPEHVRGIDVLAQSTAQDTYALIESQIQGVPALVLTDLVGASPHNCAQAVIQGRANALCLSPVSAPLLLRAINYSHLPVQRLHETLNGG